jgi:hypothetical protein
VGYSASGGGNFQKQREPPVQYILSTSDLGSVTLAGKGESNQTECVCTQVCVCGRDAIETCSAFFLRQGHNPVAQAGLIFTVPLP